MLKIRISYRTGRQDEAAEALAIIRRNLDIVEVREPETSTEYQKIYLTCKRKSLAKPPDSDIIVV